MWSYGEIKPSSSIEIASADNAYGKLRILWRHVKITKNVNRVILIIHLWLKCLIMPSFWVELYLLLSIGRDGQLHTSIYDKRDDFNFPIKNFPFLSSNIPTSPGYGVFISQLLRYVRACSPYGCFILRATRLSNKLLEQGYVKERLKSSLRKFYGRYGDLIKQYEVSLSQMLNDILWPDNIQWQPLLIRFCTELDLWPNFEWFP